MNNASIANSRTAHRHAWHYAFLIVGLAVALRIIFFNGFFGSDDYAYLKQSYRIARGILEADDYNGALRYGYNLPAAFFIWIFGLNTFSANLWTLTCSLIEVIAIFWFADRYIGRRVAIYAGFIIATFPLHIALATRIHADSVLGLFLTLSFILLYVAEAKRQRITYFLTGLSLGMVFWVKELSSVTFFAFATYPGLVRRLEPRWLWLVAGGCTMFIGHLLLMWVIAGDPLHLIKTVSGQVQHSLARGATGEDGLGYYFRYLFTEIKHTGLVGYLTVGGFLLWIARRRHCADAEMATIGYVVWWLLGLLVVLTFFPVSIDPIRFVMKQSNYLNLFLAPMAILAAFLLANIPVRALRVGLLAITMTIGATLGAMEQAAYRTFTANSRAAVEFAHAHPHDWILGSVNNDNIAWIYATLDDDPLLPNRFGYLKANLAEVLQKTPAVGRKDNGYVVLDRQTEGWGTGALIVSPVPECWDYVTTLTPASTGMSAIVITLMQRLTSLLPTALSERGDRLLDRLSRPLPAMVFRVQATDLWCKQSDHR